MVPNISQEVVLQLKNLKPGNCIAFGMAFKVPITMYIDLPDPRPLSNNVDLENVWYHEIAEETDNGIGLKLGVNNVPVPQNGMNAPQGINQPQQVNQQTILNNRIMPQQSQVYQQIQSSPAVPTPGGVQPQTIMNTGSIPVANQQIGITQPNMNIMQSNQGVQ